MLSKRKTALALFPLIAAPAAASDSAPHWQWSLSPFYAPQQSASLKVGLVFAPYSSIEEEGLRLRYEGRVAGWNDRDPVAPRSYVTEAENSLYVGYRFSQGPWRAALYAGPSLYNDNQFGLDTHFGASGIGELVWLGNQGEFVGFEARLSSIKTNWSFNAVSGCPTGWGGLKLGPEAGVGGNLTGWNARLGVAATGLSLNSYDLALGAGAMVDDQDRVAPYVSVWLSGKF